MTTRQERRLKPGKDIAPMTLPEFDAATIYIRSKVAALVPIIRANVSEADLKDPEKIDDMVKDAILREASCPKAITQLSIDRPSVYDVLASTYRYDPAKIEIQRKAMMQLQAGELSSGAAYYEVFKQTHPNSKKIIRDLQAEALEGKKKSKVVNLQ